MLSPQYLAYQNNYSSFACFLFLTCAHVSDSHLIYWTLFMKTISYTHTHNSFSVARARRVPTEIIQKERRRVANESEIVFDCLILLACSPFCLRLSFPLQRVVVNPINAISVSVGWLKQGRSATSKMFHLAWASTSS